MAIDVDPSGQRIVVPGPGGQPDLVPDREKTKRDATLIRLSTPGGAAATLYPGLGFNCIDLRLRLGDRVIGVIHSEPDILAGGKPTLSGIPILFPWPNRIAHSNFEWDGVVYHVPANDGLDRHSLHGFACFEGWTHFTPSDGDQDPSVTGVFRIARDAPDHLDEWPGNLVLSVKYTLTDDRLRIESTVSNPDDHPVPFGLGFHPYFTPLAADSIEDCRLWVGASGFWKLVDSIPTGQVEPADERLDFREAPQVGDRVLDDVLTDLPPFEPEADGLMTRARLVGGDVAMVMRCGESWRDVVVFTPPNRASIAVEPYTCPTDAVHLAAAGQDAGWRVLQPAGSWSGVVELSLTSAE